MRSTLAQVHDLPVHPRTGLTAIGIVGGRPVWPIAGGAPDPADSADGDDGDAGDDGDDTDDDDGDGAPAADAWKPPTKEEWEAQQAKLARANAQGKRLRERLTAAQQGQQAAPTAAPATTQQAPAVPAQKAAKAGGKRADRDTEPEPVVQVVDNSAEVAEWQNRAIRADAKAKLLSRGCDPDLIDAPLSRLRPSEVDWDGDDPDLDDWLDEMEERYPKAFAKPEPASQPTKAAPRRPGSIDQGASSTGRPAQKPKKYGEALIEASGSRIDTDGRLVSGRRRV